MKIKTDDIPEEYAPLVHEEMNLREIQLLGEVMVRHKLSKWKNKIMGWFKHGKE